MLARVCSDQPDGMTLPVWKVEDPLDGATYGFADLCALSGSATPRDAHRRRQLAGTADLSLCASRGADLFSAVNWDPALLEAFAFAGAGEAFGWSDYAPALHQAAMAKNALMYNAFNATGVYHVALQTVDTSVDYRTWVPTTLQVPLSLEHFHGHMSEVATLWETKAAAFLTSETRPHSDALKVSCIVESTFESAMQDGLNALTPWIFVVVAVMVAYSGTFLSTQTRTASGYATQFSLITQGSLVSGLAGRHAGCDPSTAGSLDRGALACKLLAATRCFSTPLANVAVMPMKTASTAQASRPSVGCFTSASSRSTCYASAPYSLLRPSASTAPLSLSLP